MDGRILLLKELTARKNRNTSYSLRAFARDLGVSPAALSQYLSRKRELSKKNVLSVVERLRLSPAESKILTADRSAREDRLSNVTRDLIDEDTFRMISDWVSLATLNLASLKENRADPEWIARRLAIEIPEAREAIQRLKRLSLVEIRKNKMVRTRKSFITTQDVPSTAIKRFHLGVLEKARTSLLETPVEDRDITAIVMPTDETKLKEAKRIIRRMRHRVAALVSTPNADEVYVLSVQMFPLSGRKSDA